MSGKQQSGNNQLPLSLRMQVLPVVLAATLGVVLTLSAFLAICGHDRRQLHNDFVAHAQERLAAVARQTASITRTLDQIRRFYYASNEVDASEFTLFVGPLRQRGPTFRAILWARIAPEAPGRVDVQFCESAAGESPSAAEGFPAGLDLAARPDWRDLMDRARDTDAPACSPRLPARDQGSYEIMVFLPVYKAPPPADPKARAASIRGFLVGVVSVPGLMEEALSGLSPMGTRIRLYDESAPAGDRFLYGLVRTETGRSEEKRSAASGAHPLQVSQPVPIGGRTWRIRIAPTEVFEAGNTPRTRWWALAAGLVITALVVAYIGLLLGQARRIQKQVEAQTAELRREIANREKVEQALRLQKEQAQQYLDVAGVILVVLDRQGRVVMINRKGCETLGRHETEILGIDWFDAFVSEPERAATRKAFGELVAGNGQVAGRHENDLLDSAGRKRTIAWTNALVRDEEGQVVGTLSSGSDVTDQRLAESQRRHMEAQVLHTQKLESLGVLAGGIAHDFNNILTAVLGHADLALRELSLVSPARGNLQEIINAARRAADLCRQLLAYSGKGRFVVEPVDLSALIEEMSHLIDVSISKKATLRHQFAPDLPAVEADATQLRQVVMNLITNASEAIGDASGSILVATGSVDADQAYLDHLSISNAMAPGRYVTLEVSDTGCGMDAATVQKIFDPFFSTKFAGRGLGLAAVLGIVRGHKGGIKVYSEPGKGTTFKVFLPAAAADARVHPHDTPAQVDGWRGSGTVLLADDEESVRTLGRKMLEKMGFSVLLAGDGQEAVETFRSRPGGIACVILDLTMPRTDGEEAFRALRGIDPGVRIILCSGYNEQDVTQRFVGKGLAGFIQKPFEYNALATRLRAVLDA